MNQPSSKTRSAIVVGGGISGLAAAHRLHELDPNIQLTLLESDAVLGGVLQTSQRDGYLIEASADNFITNIPWGVDLCRRVGLGDELLSTDAARRRALVVCRGRLQPVPEGFLLMQPQRCWPVMASPILSVAGKLRLACEPFVGRRLETDDESLGSFVRRRLGREAFERLVQPLVAGIYTADPEKLSMQATFGRFQEMERQHGSLMRAAARDRLSGDERTDSGARYSLFVAPRGGMHSLVDAVARRLPAGAVRTSAAVQRIARTNDAQWQVTLANGPTQVADALVVATPAGVAAQILRDVDEELATTLGEIEHAGAAVVCLGVRRDRIARPPEGFGFVVPAVEGRQIIAASFSSFKFPDRAPAEHVLMRVFVGGALQGELMELADEELQSLVERELHELVGLSGSADFCTIHRWHGKMPQYHVGHLQRVERIEARVAAQRGLAIAGNAYRGVGIPQCIHSGELAAVQVQAYLTSLAK